MLSLNEYRDNDDDAISKDSLEEDSPQEVKPQKQESDDVELVFNSMLGLYYDPKTKQHYDMKPESSN